MLVLNRCFLITKRTPISFPPTWATGHCATACPSIKGLRLLLLNRLSSARGFVAYSGPRDALGDGGFGAEPTLEYDDIDPANKTSSKSPNDSRIKETVQKKAIEILAMRSFSACILRKKLMGRKFPIKIIDNVIAELQERGLLNDGLYAESFSRSRWLSLSWGPRRIKRALLEKGISEEDASAAARHVFQDEDLSTDGYDTHFGMSKLNFDRLFDQASKQWQRSCNKALENRKNSITRWLQYRGFNWEITKFILKKLETEYPHDD